MGSTLLTASRLKDARSCQRLHRIQYGLGYRPVVEAPTLFFGRLVHLMLEAWWLATKAGLIATERLRLTFAAIPPTTDPFDTAKARAMLFGYEARWGEERYEVVAVESQFETALVNPETGRPSQTWRLAGKIDVRLGGPPRIMEHKTSSEDISPGSSYWKKLRMDGQVSAYFAGAKALGHDAEECIYDVLGKPELEPLRATPQEKRKYRKDDGKLYAGQRETDETPEQFEARCMAAIGEDPARYYQRGTVVRLDKEMDDALFDIWQTAQQLREAERLGRFPRNPDACEKWGRVCPFFGVCSGEESLEDERLFTKSSNPHPELSGGDTKDTTREVASEHHNGSTPATPHDVGRGGEGQAAAPEEVPPVRA